MSGLRLAVLGTGLVSSVGLSAAASCAAFRAKISNPTQTQFIDSKGRFIVAHEVELGRPWRGLAKLARMAAMAIEEALQELPVGQWSTLPLVLCLAEKDRPGRFDGLDEELMRMIEAELGVRFGEGSAVVPHGRVSVAVALAGARRLVADGAKRVVIAATDSLLTWPTLFHLDQEGRLLAEVNSNGFIPGEGAGAFLVGAAGEASGPLECIGFGFANERAHIGSDEPLRADGLAAAIRAALGESGIALQDLDYRLSDVAGEQYYFKEASLGIARVLRHSKVAFPLWHPAECVGEAGAAAGAFAVAAAYMASVKRYGVGPGCLLHFSNDDGRRAVMVTRAAH